MIQPIRRMHLVPWQEMKKLYCWFYMLNLSHWPSKAPIEYTGLFGYTLNHAQDLTNWLVATSGISSATPPKTLAVIWQSASATKNKTTLHTSSAEPAQIWRCPKPPTAYQWKQYLGFTLGTCEVIPLIINPIETIEQPNCFALPI